VCQVKPVGFPISWVERVQNREGRRLHRVAPAQKITADVNARVAGLLVLGQDGGLGLREFRFLPGVGCELVLEFLRFGIDLLAVILGDGSPLLRLALERPDLFRKSPRGTTPTPSVSDITLIRRASLNDTLGNIIRRVYPEGPGKENLS